MKLIFISNYFNHHQRSLCEALNARTESFTFIACSTMRDDRRALGYGEAVIPDYVLNAHTPETREKAKTLINGADVILLGAADKEMTSAALAACRRGTLTFRYSEPLIKNSSRRKRYALRRMKLHASNLSPLPPPLSLLAKGPRASCPLYLLAVGGVTADEYASFGLFSDRAFTWGYFPAVRHRRSPEELIDEKCPSEILWVGRMIDWKHPGDLLLAAKGLASDPSAPPFHVTFIGTGPLEIQLKADAVRFGLCASADTPAPDDLVTFEGPMKPDAVRDRMEKAGILVSTSDKGEGWGAVINEAMSSACAVVLPYQIGASVLLRDGENGLGFHASSVPALTAHLLTLLRNPARARRLGMNAYADVISQWNADTAAERLLTLAERLKEAPEPPDLYPPGTPCAVEKMNRYTLSGRLIPPREG